jgi:hypothetical protein
MSVSVNTLIEAFLCYAPFSSTKASFTPKNTALSDYFSP